MKKNIRKQRGKTKFRRIIQQYREQRKQTEIRREERARERGESGRSNGEMKEERNRRNGWKIRAGEGSSGRGVWKGGLKL